MSKKSWREKLEEIGGYDNEFTSVPAGAVREIIEELESALTEGADALKQLDSALELLSYPEHAQDKEWYERLNKINEYVASVSGTQESK